MSQAEKLETLRQNAQLLRAALNSFTARVSRIVDEHLRQAPARKTA